MDNFWYALKNNFTKSLSEEWNTIDFRHSTKTIFLLYIYSLIMYLHHQVTRFSYQNFIACFLDSLVGMRKTLLPIYLIMKKKLPSLYGGGFMVISSSGWDEKRTQNKSILAAYNYRIQDYNSRADFQGPFTSIIVKKSGNFYYF